MFIRGFVRFGFLILIALLGIGCNSSKRVPKKVTLGLVSYGEEDISLYKYEGFKNYIQAQTKSIVELEPAYNELQAIDQIHRKQWDIVFAPPGLAAIAIDKQLYKPLFSMGEVSSRQRSLIVVRDDSPIKKIPDLANKTIALGQIGSAAGYYVPLYDLYGLTLRNIRFAPTPKTVLQWLNEGSIDAGALSEKNFEIYRRQITETKFRIIHISRWIPPGVVLLSPNIERNREREVRAIMSKAPANITSDAGYIPSVKIPEYKQFIQLIKKVKPLEARTKETPAVLLPKEDPKNKLSHRFTKFPEKT
ncbi:ABC-type phosphate/phosphonate transport system, periplasmic component [Rivularia sp. PCC 7116]|uniref:phosphate/phosphite/phosphonate ABC transporter substrate-binding protein n=1 Tax=Rivularia sp. PCC 7116 TaxID=373994 RepID=UPI00029F0405|nr:PhnD/SsuA/transferrin family substrate-binding protein [Rivularia sp. PCC 7116]AFY53932.1 ABC-type phosphate/phosphonate transport system, periplasmic component [Rivularia sp. PCC 7116]